MLSKDRCKKDFAIANSITFDEMLAHICDCFMRCEQRIQQEPLRVTAKVCSGNSLSVFFIRGKGKNATTCL